MKAMNTRKAFQAVSRLCGDHGITVDIQSGRGSHVRMIFTDSKTGEAIPLIITRHPDISPGVQRNILGYVERLARDGSLSQMVRALAEIVRVILESIFK